MNQIDQSLATALSQTKLLEARVDALFAFMRRKGQSFYDEEVTQLQHALQCAHLARRSNGTAEQITSALLHDLGHFLMDESNEQSNFQQEDWEHELIGAEYLAPFMPRSVTDPILLHVLAKRYLCSTEQSYFQSLSRASMRSFHLQGGPMSDEEIRAVEEHPSFASALLIRRWDDGSKVVGLDVADLESFGEVVGSCFLIQGCA